MNDSIIFRSFIAEYILLFLYATHSTQVVCIQIPLLSFHLQSLFSLNMNYKRAIIKKNVIYRKDNFLSLKKHLYWGR